MIVGDAPNNEPKLLMSDPRRQAVPTLRGYSYQVWQSLYHWLKLKEREILFLEGAEDFDLLGPKTAETVQVKDTKASGNVTLNSDDIAEAINHFWEHQKNNKDREVFFRMLTTADRGQEINPPFKAGRGLDYWDLSRKDGTDLNPLRQFLSTHAKLPEQLRTYIAECDDHQLRDRLIRRIYWDTGAESIHFIEGLVVEKVCHYGTNYGVGPSECKKVVPQLLQYVWKVICKETHRYLRPMDFMELFEDATTERISKNELLVLKQAGHIGTVFGALARPVGSGDLLTISDSDLAYQMVPPPLPEKISDRQEFVSRIDTTLSEHGLLVLKGASGMGKSTVASLLAKNRGDTWTWLQLRGVQDRLARNLLYLFASASPENGNLVVEDIDFSLSGVDVAFAGLLYAMKFGDRKMIVTTQADPPFTVRSMMSNDSFVAPIPLLGAKEIEQVLLKHGCPVEIAEGWGVIILAKTTGHPQLVHAEVRRVALTGWSPLAFEDLMQSEDMEIVRQEARKRLFADLAPDARTLAYRLSILTHPFRREHALIMASKNPVIDRPGECFDLLIGPWIERLDVNVFRISPLLHGSASNIWATEEVRHLHRTAAQALTAPRQITSLEASNALLHGVFGGEESTVLNLLLSLIRQPGMLPKVVNEFLWVTMLKTNLSFFPANPFTDIFFKQFQFCVAAETDPGTIAVTIMNDWETAIEALKDESLKKVDRMLFLLQTVLRGKVPIPVNIFISRIVELEQLTDEYKIPLDLAPEEELKGLNTAGQLFLLATARYTDVEEFDELLTALSEQSPETRSKLLSPLNNEKSWANVLMNGVWLREADSSTPRWDRCKQTYKRVITLASLWGAQPLVEEAFHAIAVIEDEYEHNSGEALETLRKAESLLGPERPIINNAKAMILYRKGMNSEALGIWEILLPNWKNSGIPLASYTKAEICAAQDNNWEKMASSALYGKYASEAEDNLVAATGFEADYGFALWKRGDKCGAARAFAAVLGVFERLPDPTKDLQSYFLQKRVGHAITWFLNDLDENQRQEHAEPPGGCFSDLRMKEADYESGLKDYPVQPVIFLWLLLSELEFSVGSDADIFQAFAERAEKTSYPYIRFQIDSMRLSRDLRELNLTALLAHFEPFVESSCSVKTAFKTPFQEIEVPNPFDRSQALSDSATALVSLLISAVIIMLARNEEFHRIARFWKEDAKAHAGFNMFVDPCAGFLEQSKQLGFGELLNIMKNASSENEQRIIAAALVSAKEDVDPLDRFYSDILVFDYLSRSLWRVATEDDYVGVVSERWSMAATNQTFSLLSPRVNSPAILDACAKTGRGLRKVAKILLAAKSAVRVSLPTSTINRLVEIAGR